MSLSPKQEQLFKQANKHIPGGVNSPVRAFNGVGGTPVFIEKAKGAYLYDVDGKRYVDYVGSWGPMILGHAHPAIIQAGADLCAVISDILRRPMHTVAQRVYDWSALFKADT